MIGDGEQLIQPVSIETLVDVISYCICCKQSSMSLDIVGENCISYKTWMKHLRQKKSPSKFIKIPLGFMQFIAAVLKLFHLQLLSNDNLTMLQQNNLTDSKPLSQFMERIS